MTKKDYEKLAKALKDMRDEMARDELAMNLGRILAAENPRFDTGRWLKACGTIKC